MTYKWRVSLVPTGQYRSFDHRSWPSADYSDGSPAAHIVCEDEYAPSLVKEGKHGQLTIRVADYSATPWKWRRMKGMFTTLTEAKAAFSTLLADHPELMPRQETNLVTNSDTDCQCNTICTDADKLSD